jgi:Cu/Ag efflux protein CusF
MEAQMMHGLKSRFVMAALAFVAVGVSMPLVRAHDMEMHAWTATDSPTSQKAYWVHGRVNDANQESGVVNITHDPVKELMWPSMTMTFHVSNKALFSKLQPHTVVDFALREVAGNHYEIIDVKDQTR